MTGSRLPPRVFMASAGTGKTFQLTIRALALLTRRVAPESILATTFTRKAAGEIMERIFGRLVEAADEDDSLAELVGFLDDESLTRESCMELLGDTMRNVHRLGVQTLDAFLARLAVLRGLEIGLPPGWRIMDPTGFTSLSQAAMARVLDEAGDEEIVELLRRMQGVEPQRSAYMAIERVVTASYAIFRESTPEAWEALPPLPSLGPEALVKRIAELQLAPLPTTAKGEPDKRWVKARDAAVAAADQRDWEAFIGTGLPKKIIEDDYVYCRHPIEGALLESMEDLVGHARAEIVETIRARGRAQRELLVRYDRALTACKRAQRLFGFDDLPHALLRGESGALTDQSIALRLDGGIEHLLLDEFQDTSVMQGRVLEPLIGAVLADEGQGSFFCVGDVKQSIYGWRQGEPRLLQGLGQRYPGLDLQSLKTNYRSSAVVLDSVRQVFEGIESCTAFADNQAMRDAAKAWGESFEAPVAKKSLPGRVSLIEVESQGGSLNERRREVLVHAVDHVARLVEEAPGASIGVLVRRRAAMPAIIYGLMERGISASGEGGNPLTDSDAVRVALSVLTLADHPGDTAAWFHVATSAFAECFELTFDVATRRADAARFSAVVRRRLSVEGYGRFLAWLQDRVRAGESFDEWDRVRFGQLVDMAFTVDEDGGPDRPGDFVERVWDESVEAPTEAAVKVMTIHGSKGLEFDAVVLPDLEGRLVGSRPALLTRRTDPWAAMDVVVPGGKWNSLHPELERLAAEADGRILREELCVLYVAMTRAVRRLDLLIPGEGARSSSRSMANLLREQLAVGGGDDAAAETGSEEAGAEAKVPPGDGDGEPADTALLEGARELWRHPLSDDAWYAASRNGRSLAGTAAAEEASPASGPDEEALVLAAPVRSRWLPSVAPSAHGSGHRFTSARLLDLTDEWARVRGLIVHAWLSTLEWLEAFAPTDETLHALATRLAREESFTVSRGSVAKLIEEFRAMLRQPLMAAELTRGESSEAEVWRERSFAVSLPVDGVETMVRGAFDRVVLQREGGELVSADVLDYKTDALPVVSSTPARRQLDLFAGAAAEAASAADPQSALREKAEHYRPQMETYRAVLSRLTGLAPDAIRCRLLFLVPDQVVEL